MKCTRGWLATCGLYRAGTLGSSRSLQSGRCTKWGEMTEEIPFAEEPTAIDVGKHEWPYYRAWRCGRWVNPKFWNTKPPPKSLIWNPSLGWGVLGIMPEKQHEELKEMAHADNPEP